MGLRWTGEPPKIDAKGMYDDCYHRDTGTCGCAYCRGYLGLQSVVSWLRDRLGYLYSERGW